MAPFTRNAKALTVSPGLIRSQASIDGEDVTIEKAGVIVELALVKVGEGTVKLVLTPEEAGDLKEGDTVTLTIATATA